MRFWEPAQNMIQNITEPQVNVSVGNVFLPDSEIQYQLNWLEREGNSTGLISCGIGSCRSISQTSGSRAIELVAIDPSGLAGENQKLDPKKPKIKVITNQGYDSVRA